MDNARIAELLFGALANVDDQGVRDLCSPALRVRQNNGAPIDLQTLLGFNTAVHQVVKDLHYADAVRSATRSGFVEEHAVRGTLPDGRAIALAVCVVADVGDGKVTDIREYFDTAAAADLFAALG